MSDIIKKLENHLNVPTNSIRITEGARVFDTQKTRDRNLIFKHDILKVSASVSDFIQTYIPAQGYKEIRVQFKKKNGSGHKETDYSRTQQPIIKYGEALETKHEPVQQQTTHAMQQPVQPPAQPEKFMFAGYGLNGVNTQIPPMGLGMAQIQQHDLTSLNVTKERYEDFKKTNKDLESKVLNLESELRIVKEDKSTLQRKLDTQEDRHKLEIERIQLNQKSFVDTDGFKTLVEGLGGIVPAIINRNAPAALGGATANVSQRKKEFIQIVENPQITDAHVEMLKAVITAYVQNEEFANQLNQILYA